MKSMGKQADFYRTKTKQVEENFTEENKQYYDKLSKYLSTASFYYDETEVSEQIFQFASDLLAAQENGETAQEYFGDSPKAMADQLIKGFKKQSKARQFKWITYISACGIISELLVSFGHGNRLQLNLWNYLITIAVVLLGIELFFYALHHTIYDTKYKLFNLIKNNKILSSIASFLIWSLLILSGGLLVVFSPKNFVYTVPQPADIILIGIICLSLSVIVWRRNDIFRSFLIMIWLFPLPGFFRRIPSIDQFFNTDSGIYMSLGFMFLSMFLFIIVFSKYAKKAMPKQQ